MVAQSPHRCSCGRLGSAEIRPGEQHRPGVAAGRIDPHSRAQLTKPEHDALNFDLRWDSSFDVEIDISGSEYGGPLALDASERREIGVTFLASRMFDGIDFAGSKKTLYPRVETAIVASLVAHSVVQHITEAHDE